MDPYRKVLFHKFKHTGTAHHGGERRHIYMSACGSIILHLKQKLMPQDPRFGCTCSKCLHN
jgi:hypothetical protein